MPRLRAYKKPDLPEQFVLVAADGEDVGQFRAEDFVPYEPERGAVMVQYPGERPIILRVVKQEGNRIWSKDGTGETWEYRIWDASEPMPAVRGELSVSSPWG